MTAPTPTAMDAAAARRCAGCQHLWSEHDDIAARFCAATIVSASSRGCVCVPNATTGTAEAAG